MLFQRMFWGCQATRFSRGFSTDCQTWSWKMGVPPGKKKLMWSTHLNIFRVLVLEKSINIGYFARGNLRSDQTNWVSSWGLGMPRNLNRSAINHINLKLQTYSFFFITDWCSLSMFQPVSACSSLFQPVPAIQIPGWDPKHFTHLRRRLGRAAWFPRPAENLFLTKLCSSNWAYTVYGHFGKSPYGIWFFLFHIWLFSKWWY